MRNDELKRFSAQVLKELRCMAVWNRDNAACCASIAHSEDGQSRSDWESSCVEYKRRACAYEQAAALIEAAIK